MSTPNPTHIIADALNERELSESMPDELAAHVVSKLTDAGYSIVPTADAIEVATITKELAYLIGRNDEFGEFEFGYDPNSTLR